MIRPELKADIESIVARLDEQDSAERGTKSVLLTLLSAIEANQEVPLMIYVSAFAERFIRALSQSMARRN